MADDNTGVTPEPDDNPTPQDRRKPPAAAPEPDDSLDRDRLKSALEKERQLRKKENQEFQELKRWKEQQDQAQQEAKDKELSEADRIRKALAESAKRESEATRRAEALEKEMEQTKIDNAVEREATRMGWIYPDIAASLLPRDPERSRISIDPETGQVKGAKEALERLVKDKPELVRAPPRGGTPPRENGGGRGGYPAGVGPNNQAVDPVQELLKGGGYY